MSAINKVGEVRRNSQGLKMKIISYRNCRDIDVEFEDGFIKCNTTYELFKNGTIKSYYNPDKYGFYKGYSSSVDLYGKETKCYRTWLEMRNRCYKESYHKKYNTYKDCEVCEEWKCFDNFKKWYDDNYYEIEGEKMCLDKDILVKGNKIYSPDTCIFVPERINLLFVKTNKLRGELPIGVRKYMLKDGRTQYRACWYENNKKVQINKFKTIEDAFNCYKQGKEKHIKDVSKYYKDKYPNFPDKLYSAMNKYEYTIND